ncbi:MAG: serine hydrolase [Candidatus Binatia bacterium]
MARDQPAHRLSRRIGRRPLRRYDRPVHGARRAAARRRRAVREHRSAGARRDDARPRSPIPAANGLFTARGLARLYAALAAGGTLDGVRLLSPETVRKVTTVQTRQRDRVILFRPMWRLGYHGLFTTAGPVAGGFDHFGFGGSGAWGDPKRELAVGFVNNRAGGTPLGDFRILQIGAAAIRCADRAPSRRRKARLRKVRVPAEAPAAANAAVAS